MIVCIVQSAYDNEPRQIELEKVINGIQTGGKKLKGAITQIRNRFDMELELTKDYNAAKKVVSDLKCQLPGVLYSAAKAAKRENGAVQEHSGLLCTDMDHLTEQEIQTVRATLTGSPHVFMLFRSPCGDGLKAVFRVLPDASRHNDSYRAIEQYVLRLTGKAIDEKCKDIARMNFMSYDDQLYVNHHAVPIDPLDPEPRRERTSSSSEDLNLRQKIVTDVCGPLEWNGTIGQGYCPCQHLHQTGKNQPTDFRFYIDGKPSCICFHTSCRGALEGINHEVRSRIGKAEKSSAKSAKPTYENDSSAEAEGDDVPEPLLYKPPPLDFLPSRVQDFILAASESLDVDVAFILFPLLSGMAAAIGNARSIMLKQGFWQPPVVWTAIIAGSGKRKTPSLDVATFFALDRERELIEANEIAKKFDAEEMAAWEALTKKERTGKIKPESRPGHTHFVDDMTLAALADMMHENPKGLFIKKDELSHWYASMDQFHDGKGSDISRWLQLHGGIYFGLDRRSDKRRYRIINPRVSITGGIQPGVFKRVMTQDYFERGLPARFLFAAPPIPKPIWTDKIIQHLFTEGITDIANALYALQPGDDDRPIMLNPMQEAKEIYVAFFNECGNQSTQASDREEAAWSKLSGYAARISLEAQLMHDCFAHAIKGDIMEKSCNFIRWCGAETMRIYRTLTESPEECERNELVAFIRRRYGNQGEASVKDVLTYYWPLRKQRAKIESHFEALVKEKKAVWMEKPTTEKGGRPSRKIRLSAEHAHFSKEKPSSADKQREPKANNGQESQP